MPKTYLFFQTFNMTLKNMQLIKNRLNLKVLKTDVYKSLLQINET